MEIAQLLVHPSLRHEKDFVAEDKLHNYYAMKLRTGERVVTENVIIPEDEVDYIDRN